MSAGARACAARARALAEGLTRRERGHLATIAQAIDGDAAGALTAVAAHCADFPRDALVLQLNFGAFGLISFAGHREHDEELFDFFAPYVDAYGDDWWFRFAWAWAHTESGRVAEGHRLMEQAFALNPRNANAVHGIAHVFYEEGDPGAGVKFLAEWLPGYDRAASLHCHLTWHTALFELVRGDVARARAAFEDGIRARVAPLAPPTNVLTDGVSLLWRLFLDGEPVDPAEWAGDRASSRTSASRPPRPTSTSCTASWRGRPPASGSSSSSAWRSSGGARPPARSSPAPWSPPSAKGSPPSCAATTRPPPDAIAPHVDDIVRCGGSHAQQDVWEETLIAAWIRSGQADQARRALAQRLASRPSPRAERWLARAVAIA